MKNVFLYSSALLFFSLPYHTAVKYIAMVLVFLSGVFIIIKEKSFKMDLLNLILLGFGIETLISGLLYTNELKRVLYAQKDLWIIISGFLIYRSVYLNKDDILKFIVLPLAVSSIVLFFCGLYKYYILHDHGRYHLFANVNRSAIYSVISLSFILPFLEIVENKIKYILLTGIFFIVLTIEFLASRNAIITMFIIFMIYFFIFSNISRKSKILITGFLGISFVMVSIYYGMLVNKIEHFTHIPYRFSIWKAGLYSYLNSENFFLGIGTNNFKSIDLTPYISNWHTHITSVHNLFFEILVENGILGLGLYLTFLILIIMKFKNYKSKENIFFKSIILLLTTHFLTSLTETTLIKEHGLLLFIFLAISLSQLEFRREKL